MIKTHPVHVAVGVIKNQKGEILISKRHKKVHQGNLWEFPGGKVEAGENIQQALSRELKEELNISVQQASPLIKINHQYSDLAVCLNVWLVDEFSGEVKACEGQPIQWVIIDSLRSYDFPAANLPIISAASLPRCYAILNGNTLKSLQQDLSKVLANEIKLIQLRAKSLSENDLKAFLNLAIPLCKKNEAALLINSDVINVSQFAIDGLHLTSAHLTTLIKKPDGLRWVSASCHTLQDLQLAEQHQLDFTILGPVLPTQTHPDTIPLGWEKFAQMVDRVNIPVYALGGLEMKDLETACHSGGQGISGIRAFIR
jgi:8-oxo-dGTP diphosphatase